MIDLETDKDIDISIFKDCKYIGIDDLSTTLNDCDGINILQLNIRGLYGKLDALCELLDEVNNVRHKIDMIMLNETWMIPEQEKLCVIPGYKFLFKNRINRRGGGVAIMYRENLTIRKLSVNFDNIDYESLFVKVKLKSKKSLDCICGTIYRVPNSSERDFVQKYESLLTTLQNQCKNIILGGDFNIDLLKTVTHSPSQNFLESNLRANLVPLITIPTRVTHSTATLIDHVFTSMKIFQLGNCQSRVLKYELSDHYPCLISLGLVVKKNTTPRYILTRNLNEPNVQKVKNRLSKLNWDHLKDLDCNTAFTNFHQKILEVLNEICPEHYVRVNSKRIKNEWMTVGLTLSGKTLQRKFKSIRTESDKDQYREYRKILTRTRRYAKRNYYASKIEAFKNNSKKLWTLINRLIGKESDKSNYIEKVEIDHIMVMDRSEIANSFGKYFSEVGLNLASNIKSTKKTPQDYFNNMNVPNSLYLFPTDCDEIRSIIMQLPNKTSCGLDGISNVLLKKIKEEVLQPICEIFQKSLSEGTFLDDMKKAKISPLYKSKERFLLNNYRPISLLITLSKCLEKLMHGRISTFMEEYNLFNDSQYGFRKKKSTIHAILDLVGSIVSEHEKGNYTGTIFVDLSKAFDTISYDNFFTKLEQHGIRGVALKWMTSYLNNRTHQAMVNDVLSKPFEVKIGCPQGSILGPLCYIIFVNCISSSITAKVGLRIISYADDTTLLYSSPSVNVVVTQLQESMQELSEYFRANKLSINLTKTEFMLFTCNKDVPTSSLSINIDGFELKYTNTFKFLGVILDSNLNWTPHVKFLLSKLANASFAINSVKDKIGVGNSRNLYYAMYYSHLTYGIQAWGTMISKRLLKNLSTNQNRLLKRICGSKQRDSPKPCYARLDILPINDVISQWQINLLLDSQSDCFPSNLKKLMCIDKPKKITTRFSQLPQIQQHRTKKFNDSYLTQCRSIWENSNPIVKKIRYKKGVRNYYMNELKL